jgi:hypothetical protein
MNVLRLFSPAPAQVARPAAGPARPRPSRPRAGGRRPGAWPGVGAASLQRLVAQVQADTMNGGLGHLPAAGLGGVTGAARPCAPGPCPVDCYRGVGIRARRRQRQWCGRAGRRRYGADHRAARARCAVVSLLRRACQPWRLYAMPAPTHPGWYRVGSFVLLLVLTYSHLEADSAQVWIPVRRTLLQPCAMSAFASPSHGWRCLRRLLQAHLIRALTRSSALCASASGMARPRPCTTCCAR